MRKIETAVFICLLAMQGFGNSGTYYSNGSTIFPVQETVIEMKSEILTLRKVDNKIIVDVRFEFFNPEQEKELLVGFVTPESTGDVPKDKLGYPLINKFITSVDGNILPYEVKVSGCDTCEIVSPGEYSYQESGAATFIYLSKINFKEGITVVNHSYEYMSSSSVSFHSECKYVLTTGTKWAGGKIGSFELNIDMGENSYFYVNSVLEANTEPIDWKIVGTGKVTETMLFPDKDEYKSRMIRIISGYLHWETTDFRPSRNLWFGEIINDCFVSAIHRNSVTEKMSLWLFYSLKYKTSDSLDSLSTFDLEFIRNYYYAAYGYDFRNEEVKEMFTEFDWYIPNPNLKLTDIELTIEQNRYIAAIIEEQDKRKHYLDTD